VRDGHSVAQLNSPGNIDTQIPTRRDERIDPDGDPHILGMLEGGRGVLGESASLGRVTEEVTGSMAEMAAGAEQIAIAAGRVSDLSRENKDSVDSLMLEVGRFKID